MCIRDRNGSPRRWRCGRSIQTWQCWIRSHTWLSRSSHVATATSTNVLGAMPRKVISRGACMERRRCTVHAKLALAEHSQGLCRRGRRGSGRLVRRGLRSLRSYLLGDHVDGSARALPGAQPAALAEVEVDAEPLAGAELDDGVVRTDAKAVVALEAVAARQAAPRLEQRGLLVEPAVDLLERALATRERELGLVSYTHLTLPTSDLV